MKIATHPYKSKYLDCAIVVESDAIVPDTDWKSALDDAGLLTRDYGAWELALVRSIAWTIVGERSPDLLGPPVLELGVGLGLALCEALERGEPRDLLGEELIAKLRAVPLVEVLGGTKRGSIAEVAALFSGSTDPSSRSAANRSPTSRPSSRPRRSRTQSPSCVAARSARRVASSHDVRSTRCSSAGSTRTARNPPETVPPAGAGRVEFRGHLVRGTVGL